MLNRNIINLINQYLPNYFIIDDIKCESLIDLDSYINNILYNSYNNEFVIYKLDLPSSNKHCFELSLKESKLYPYGKQINYKIISRHYLDDDDIMFNLMPLTHLHKFIIIICKYKLNNVI